MSSPQEQYAEVLRSSQDAVVEAMESWTRSARDVFGQMSGTPRTAVEPTQVIDQVFDFAERMLEVQREFSKSLAATAASAGESVQRQAESAGETFRQQAEATTEAASKQTRAAAPRRSTTAGDGGTRTAATKTGSAKTSAKKTQSRARKS